MGPPEEPTVLIKADIEKWVRVKDNNLKIEHFVAQQYMLSQNLHTQPILALRLVLKSSSATLNPE